MTGFSFLESLIVFDLNRSVLSFLFGVYDVRKLPL
jgi:hypothetical protein